MDSKLLLNQIEVNRLSNYPDRPTVIFLHDSLGSIELWKDFPSKFGNLNQCNVLIYDRQGHGKSCKLSSPRSLNYLEQEADILLELIKYWNLQEVWLFGHSDGGSIALVAAAKYPELIKGLFVEAAHIFVEDQTIKGIKDAVELYRFSDLKLKLERYHGNKTEALFWAWANTWTSSAFSSWDISNYLPSITCPTLIIQGEEDDYGTLKQVSGIAQGCAGYTEQFILPGIGHNPHREAPELTLEVCSQFFLSQLDG